jgi:hypothetical protein
MSESPFCPSERGPKAKKLAIFVIAAAVMFVIGVVSFLVFSGDGTDGKAASDPADERAAHSSGSRDSGAQQAQGEEARDVAGEFIEAVYGYYGDSEEEYRQGVMEHSQSYDLLSSPGAEEIQNYAEHAGEEGLSTAARLTGFEVRRASDKQITVSVEFVAGEGDGGRITGERRTYRQQLSLRPHQDTYKVNYATIPEPV